MLLGGTGVISWSPVAWLSVFSGGLVAGLLTRGSWWEGALAGVPSGIVSAAGATIHSFIYPAAGAGDGTFSLVPLVLAVCLFAATNATCGAIGSAARAIGRELRFSAGTAGHGSWRPMAGILPGAALIPLVVLSTGSLSFFLVLPPLAGGALAGACAAGGPRRGAGAGFLTALVGIGILAVPVIWLSSLATGFVAGLGGIILVVMSFFSFPAATAGGLVAGYLAQKLLKTPPECPPGSEPVPDGTLGGGRDFAGDHP